MSDNQSPRQMTEEERDELRNRLAKETEEYFQNCRQSEYKGGWNEATWEKEMAEHPLFANSLPESDGELPPLLEALRQIKYDDKENSPEELARNYKEDGNHSFKCKDYRLAIASYTEGIQQKTLNKELNAQLFLNRAAAHFHLNNFETALADCIQALDFKEDYVKAMMRAANCCWNLRRLDQCEVFCEQIVSIEKDGMTHKEATELKERVGKERKLQERNKRKREKELVDKRNKETAMLEAFTKAGVTFNAQPDDGEILPNLQPRFPDLRDFAVSLNDGQLVWPVALVYPELKETDFVQRWSDSCTFKQMLEAMYDGQVAERPVIGDESTLISYDPKELQCWYKSSKSGKPVKIRTGSSLRLVLSQKDFVVEDGVPSFWVTRKESEAEREFVKLQSDC